MSAMPVILCRMRRWSNRALGTAGEDAALARYLADGYCLVARNWRCRLGEIDLVLARGRTLVICEVKCRRGSGFGGPYEAVTDLKQRKLAMLAEAFLQCTGARPDMVRFDVASVVMAPSGRTSVEMFEHAF
jgi:putative endonuclease